MNGKTKQKQRRKNWRSGDEQKYPHCPRRPSTDCGYGLSSRAQVRVRVPVVTRPWLFLLWVVSVWVMTLLAVVMVTVIEILNRLAPGRTGNV